MSKGTGVSGVPLAHRFKQKNELKFGTDGKFRILHLTDIHQVMPEMDDDEDRSIPENKCNETINVIEKAIERTNPDFIVLGGDNINGFWQEFTYDLVEQTIDAITAPIRARNIPFAAVFGNHDSEIKHFFREFQMMLYMRYDNFCGCLNQEQVYGCGNCNITVNGSRSERPAFNIWLIDSNDYPYDSCGKKLDGYDCVHADQIDWYERTAQRLKAENGGEALPAILFQHIPVAQELDLLTEADENEPNCFEKDGKRYTLKSENYISGVIRERPCTPANGDRAQFESWKKQGDIVAAFFGHDHLNDFAVELDGIKLIQTFAAGYHTYGNVGGGRLIVLDENNPREIFTESFTVPKIYLK